MQMQKLLLDENLPIDLRHSFSSDFQVFTVKFLEWDSLQNGKLLSVMKENGFHALVTADKKLQFQQNLEKHGVRILILNCNNTLLSELIRFVPFVEKELKNENGSLAVLINKE
jgi:predicted nuclease of predicted toxin-antitoxin system